METRQLAYFLLACQQQNHVEAARELGIAPSTLSASIGQLEEEIGLTLFRRAYMGLYPTREACWLYQEAESVLLALEAAESNLSHWTGEPLELVEIASPLRFAIGRIHRAATAALRRLQADFPMVVGQIRFARDRTGTDGTTDFLPRARRHRVIIDYAGDADGGRAVPAETVLAEDAWVVVTGADGQDGYEDGAPLDRKDLARHPPSLPDLPPTLVDQALAWFAARDLPPPELTGEDMGALPGLSSAGTPFRLLLPRTILSRRLRPVRLLVHPLAEPLVSRLVARAEGTGPAVAAVLRHLADEMATEERNLVFQPHITTRQIRYALAVHASGSVTRAARHANLAQPALSSQLRKLEGGLGTPLFLRNRNGLRPTPAGETFAELCGGIVERMRRIAVGSAQAAAHRPRLRLGLIPVAPGDRTAVAVAAAMADWWAAHAGAEVRMIEAPDTVIEEWLAAGGVDLAVIDRVDGPAASRAAQLDLGSTEPLVIVSNPDFGLLPPGDTPLSRLAELPLALPPPNSGLRRILDRAAGPGIRIRPALEVGSPAAALAMVSRAAFATVLPVGAATLEAVRGALRLDPIVPAPHRRLAVAWSADRSLTPAERDFISRLRRQLAVLSPGGNA